MRPNNGQTVHLTNTYDDGAVTEELRSNALPSRVPTAQKESSATLEILEAKALSKEMALDEATTQGFKIRRVAGSSIPSMVPLR